MNKHIIITALCFLFALEVFAQAGPTNGDQYRSFIRTNGFRFGNDHNGEGQSNRIFFLLKGEESSGTAACLFDTTSGVGYQVSTVYNTSSGPAPHVNTSPGTVKEVINTNAPTTLMDVTMMAWDHGCGASSDFHHDPNCDFNKEAACTTIDTKEGPQGVYHEQWYTIKDTAQIRMQKVWKPTFGEDYTSEGGANGPLTFGTIGLNEYRVHENGNRSRPAGSPADMGYKNWYYNGRLGDDPVFTSSPDVTYSFSKTQTSYAIVSLDFPETNFDTRVYVLRDDGSNNGAGGSFGWRTEVNATNGNAVFSWPTLPAGDYFIVVEGESDLERGDYKMTVALPSTYEPGTITHPNLLVPRGCVLDTDITSGVQPETSLGDLEFQWEYKSREKDPWEDISGAISETLSGEELGAITDSTFVRRRLKSMGGAAYTNTLAFAKQDPDGGNISGRVTGPNGATGVGDVAMIIKSDDNNTCKPDTFFTSPNGTYNTANLFIGSYTVTPMYQNHGFEPSSLDVTINSTNGVEDQNFKDTTTLFVEGLVAQTDSLNTSCPLPGVTINTIDRSEQGVSSEDGTYTIAIEPGVFSFEASFMDSAHTFVPASHDDVIVNANLTGLDYESTTTHTVSGTVMACGGFCYGGVEIRLVDDYGCFDYRLETDQCGNFSATLPARNYQLIVTDTDLGLAAGFDADIIQQFFANKDTTWADLSSSDTVMTLVYEQSPIVTLRPHTDSTGIQPVPNCSQDTVLEQLVPTTLVFDIIEPFTGGCRLDTGIMVMVDMISGRDTVYVPISDGVVMYDVIPDTPRLAPFSPYQALEYYAMNLDSQLVSPSQKINAIVTGFKARNSTFVTVSPEIPLLILRDPPGDQSFAEVMNQESSEISFGLSTLVGGSVSVWSQAKMGAKFEAGVLGISTESEVWGTIDNSIEVGASNTTTEELTLSLTNTTTYKTRDDDAPQVLGANGDIFVGAAFNLLYAQADVIEFNNAPGVCEVEQGIDILMGTDSLATTYAYTAHNIKNNIIPKLAFLRDNGPADSIWWYQSQMEVWQQTLDRNDYLKSIADTSNFNVSRLSIDGGVGEFSESMTRSSTFSSEYEFKVEIDSKVAVAAGFEVAGAGASGGVQINLRAEMGLGGGSKTLKSRTTSYTINDDDVDDIFSFQILECPTYATPIFKEDGSETSCPYIPGTVARDQPILMITNPVRGADTPLDPLAEETFVMTIFNNSQTNEERSYFLDIIDDSNPNSAIVSENLTGSGDNRVLFSNIPYGESKSRDVRIKKAAVSSVFTYEDIKFVAYPQCEEVTSYTPQTSSIASVSLYYDSPCSEIDMNLPVGSWEVSEDDGDLLAMNMSVENTQLMDSVVVEYSRLNQDSWNTLANYSTNEVPTTNFDVNVSSLVDGEYDIRLKLYCNGGVINTPRASGIIDRVAPTVFGTPQPLDDVYDQSANDEISVTFEEDIACANATVLLTDMETLEVIPATLSCSGNKAIIVPDIVLDTRGPAIYRVTLSGVEDLYGNVRDDYRWVFIVGDYTYDPDCSPVNITNNNVDQDAISQSVYRATEITSDGTVAKATQVGYVAQDNVSLEQGFTVSEDGTLEISIENCND